MKFRTEILIPVNDYKITHACNIAIHGSCFAENIALKLLNAGLSIDLNSSGIAYNPLSLSQNLNRLLDNQPFNASELFLDNGVYHSFSNHGSFSGIEQDEILMN
jgi:hypothetical protein